MRDTENLGTKLCAGVLAVLVAAGAAWGIWRDAQPKFRDVTICVGEELPALADYLTAYAVAEKCVLVTDCADVDTNLVGSYPVTVRSGAREETVELHVEDRLAPELEVKDLEVILGTQLQPENFVTHLWDHSQVEVSFAREIQVPEDYGTAEAELIARDIYGNETAARCSVRFLWMHPEFTLEYGTKLTREDILYNAEKDAHLIPDAELEKINAAGVGVHELVSTAGDDTLVCRITVQDTQGPVLELKEFRVYQNGKATLEDFLVSATDISGEVQVELVTQPDTMVMGPQTIRVKATDLYGNETIGETTLYVASDNTPPEIKGAGSPLTVDKHSQPDYLEGVYAQDKRDGQVEVTVDASRVNTDAAGTYFLTYTAKDSSGNVSTVRRKVVVRHDAEDTAALVAEIAGSLENDPEKIRDYVRRSITYSTNWGGDDPVWMGFTERHGNCYVHALCLKSILDLKGYNTQLIWVSCKTHYWLIIEIEPGVWRHIDPTPSNLHGRYSLMTDAQRQSTLSGRVWDRDQWPACE